VSDAHRVNVDYPVDGLVSFHYFRDDASMRKLIGTGRVRLIGDSGAFSAHTGGTPIDLVEYAEWVRRWRDDLLWAASLDVIGDPDATWRNWLLLRDRHGLDTVPTVHAGTDPSVLDRYVDEGATLVGLGGMAGKGQAQKAYRWAVAMFRRARDLHPGVRYHLWGVTSRKYLDHLPAWSADSSGTLSRAPRFGALRLCDPNTGADLNVILQGRNIYRVGALVRRVYGVDPALLERATPANRNLLVEMTAASTQQYAGWLQRRHRGVTPPGLLDGCGLVGPRIHIVSSFLEDMLVAVGMPSPARARRAGRSASVEGTPA
jgi:hypothetical protein